MSNFLKGILTRENIFWPSLRQPGLQWVGQLTGLVVLAVGLLYNQPYYPATWQDEGFVMQGALNLVRHGQYAMESVEGFRVLDQPLIANGPGVVLPISLAFMFLGIGLLQARLVVMIYALWAAISFCQVSKRLSGTWGALISVALLLALPSEGYLVYSRLALGNIPALAYFLTGFLLWLTSIERQSLRRSVGAGLLLGLAVVTKGQYILLIPILLAALVINYLYLNRSDTKYIAILLLSVVWVMGLWYLIQFILVGRENFSQHLEAIASSSRVTVFAFRSTRFWGSLAYLVRSGLAFVILPGVVYVGGLLKKKDQDSIYYLVLVIFVLVWLGWYLVASVGWPRYSFDPYVIGLLCTGKLIQDLVTRYKIAHDATPRAPESPSARSTEISKPGWRQKRTYFQVAALLGGVSIALVSIGGLLSQVAQIVTERNTSAQRFANFLQTNVGPQAVVESWEWELDALTTLRYHHPPNIWVDRYTAWLQFNEPVEASYDPAAFQPDYVIDGPFSKWTGLYAEYLAQGCCIQMTHTGQYDLYRVISH